MVVLFGCYLKSYENSGKSSSGLWGLQSSLQGHNKRPEGAAGGSSPRSCSPVGWLRVRDKSGQEDRRHWEGAVGFADMCQIIDISAGLKGKLWS